MVTVRFDDISPNTDFQELIRFRKEFEAVYGVENVQFLFAVNPFAKENPARSVYDGVPFKDKDKKFFYDVDCLLINIPMLGGRLIAHGLLHADHSRLDRDAQEMSILTCCNLLNTKDFIPPFNRYNQITEDICRENGITLYKLSDGWMSLELNDFNIKHEKLYLHPWAWTVESLRLKLSGGIL